jgi:uncharacterized protein
LQEHLVRTHNIIAFSITSTHTTGTHLTCFLDTDVVKDGVFYGRYWGCLAEPEIKNLHFETCYWSAIEYCIDHGLVHMEPGAGGGDYKWARGFDAALIHSVHYISHPGLRRAIHQFIDQETQSNVEATDYLQYRRQNSQTTSSSS